MGGLPQWSSKDCASTAGGTRSTHGRGTKNTHATRSRQKKTFFSQLKKKKLKKQLARWIWPAGHSSSTPGLDHSDLKYS